VSALRCCLAYRLWFYLCYLRAQLLNVIFFTIHPWFLIGKFVTYVVIEVGNRTTSTAFQFHIVHSIKPVFPLADSTNTDLDKYQTLYILETFNVKMYIYNSIQVKCEVNLRELHRKRATGAVLPDKCGSGFSYKTWIIQHKLKKYMHLLMNKSTLKCVNNITDWNILRRKHPWACIRYPWYLVAWSALCTSGRWGTCACCDPMQRTAAQLDDFYRFKRVFNN